MTQEKNVTEQHKKPSALSQMITVKNICSLSTERHKREIYKAVYDEDGRPVLHKQPTCKNKELTTALEPISRQTEEFQEFMPVEAFEKKGEKDGINFDIVMQLEMEEGKQIKVKCSKGEVEQIEKIPNEGIESIKAEKTEVSRTPHECSEKMDKKHEQTSDYLELTIKMDEWDTKSVVIVMKGLHKLEEFPALHKKWSEMEKSVQEVLISAVEKPMIEEFLEQIEFTGKSEQYGTNENYSQDTKIDATKKSTVSWKLTNSMEKKDDTNQYFHLNRPSKNQMWPKERKGGASGAEESNSDDKYLLAA
ncbi:Uncharacterized protein BM_BM18191 [Brugia malayi]|uniref:Uncharacterized protein n=1 Tax=Brugia malayi TaxID=6279 RepID=A0A4E9EUD9_BRUMA|nr:Uncharacterized protein BM_BM18191 [Brugia malayi]VIO87214.1 Uncharacterized protein BM_BM18191 [Brugia malayi]